MHPALPAPTFPATMSSDCLDVLPVSLDLVRVPRARVRALVRPILGQLLAPDPVFFALTANEIELSIFAANAADAFRSVARRDARRRACPSRPDWEAVEVSTDKWKVIQIPSLDDSGAHLHEVSAPIAAAGISILYQCSHQNDFLFVKESHLRDVLLLLANVGFTPLDGYPPGMDPCEPPSETPPCTGRATGACLARNHSSSVSPSPRPRSSTISSLGSLATSLERALEAAPPPAYAPTPAEVRILAPELTCIGLPQDRDSTDAWLLKLVKLLTYPELVASPPPTPADDSALELDSPFFDRAAPRSRSPPSSGSSDDSYDDDASSYASDSPDSPIISALPSPVHERCSSRKALVAPFFSFTRVPEGASLAGGVGLLAALFPPHERPGLSCADSLDGVHGAPTRLCLQVDLRRCALDSHGLVHRFARVLEEHAIDHVYSSTFKTANILVNGKDAARARALLALC